MLSDFLLSKLLTSSSCSVEFTVSDGLTNVNIKLQNIYKLGIEREILTLPVDLLKILPHRPLECCQEDPQNKISLKEIIQWWVQKLLTQSIPKAY